MAKSEQRPVLAGSHSIRSATPISEASLRQYLESKQSSLADFSGAIARSPYASTIIAICTIEEYSCRVNPYDSNNLWGLMSGGHLIRFGTLDEGISAIDSFLARAEANGRTTIESLNGWYVQPASDSWLAVVLTTKSDVESLSNH